MKKISLKLFGILLIVLGIVGLAVSIIYSVMGGGRIADTLSGAYYAMVALIVVGVMLLKRAIGH